MTAEEVGTNRWLSPTFWNRRIVYGTGRGCPRFAGRTRNLGDQGRVNV